MSSGKPQIGNISAAYANLPIMFFQGTRHDPFEKNVEEGGGQKTSLLYSDCCSEPFSYTAILLDYTCSLEKPTFSVKHESAKEENIHMRPKKAQARLRSDA